MSPQDKFNTGQKFFDVVVARGYSVFGVTGLVAKYYKDLTTK